MGIIVTKPGAKAQRLERINPANESDFQRYGAENPGCLLSVEEIQGHLRLLVVAKEFPTESGPIGRA